MSEKRILLLDIVHPIFPALLEELGFAAEIWETEKEKNLTTKIVGYCGIVVRNYPKITAELIDAGKNLRFIARSGSGLENIDYEYAKRLGIEVLHSPEGSRDAVGEHALGLAICLLKKIIYSSLEVKRGKWEREANCGNEIIGKTVGIIGYGNTGSSFAQKLRGLSVEVLAYDKYKTGFSCEYVTETTLENLQQRSDIISFHVPLTKETVHYADEEFFNKCKKQILLLNTSRGKVVSEKALCKSLKSGKVFAAGIDVVEGESWNFNFSQSNYSDEMRYLLSHPNVIITPHIAGITYEAKERHAYVLTEKIKLLLI